MQRNKVEIVAVQHVKSEFGCSFPYTGPASVGTYLLAMRRCHWVKPTMVCQIKFTEWTRDDCLRQLVFLGIREDKNAKEVVRERAS
jgi:ATP-dependent DNA ligase